MNKLLLISVVLLSLAGCATGGVGFVGPGPGAVYYDVY